MKALALGTLVGDDEEVVARVKFSIKFAGRSGVGIFSARKFPDGTGLVDSGIGAFSFARSTVNAIARYINSHRKIEILKQFGQATRFLSLDARS